MPRQFVSRITSRVVSGAWSAPLREAAESMGAAYAPYRQQVATTAKYAERALRYGALAQCTYEYTKSKHDKYQERGDDFIRDPLGADEVKLTAGLAGFALGFSQVSTAVKHLGASVGMSSKVASVAAASSVTAAKETVLGESIADIALATSGKIAEKYSPVSAKVVAKAQELSSGFNPITKAPTVLTESVSEKSQVIVARSKAVMAEYHKLPDISMIQIIPEQALKELVPYKLNPTKYMKEQLQHLHDEGTTAVTKPAAHASAQPMVQATSKVKGEVSTQPQMK